MKSNFEPDIQWKNCIQEYIKIDVHRHKREGNKPKNVMLPETVWPEFAIKSVIVLKGCFFMVSVKSILKQYQPSHHKM